MGTTDQSYYSVRWHNHRSNLLLTLGGMFQTESFTDVTLACEGGSIKCHKVVLAAGSSYFQELLQEHDCGHTIVILRDIHLSELKLILEYMYKGEVNIKQHQLPALMKVAATLKVKGLILDHQVVTTTPHSSTPGNLLSAQHSGGSAPLQPPPPWSPQPYYDNNPSCPVNQLPPISHFFPKESPYSAFQLYGTMTSVPAPIYYGGIQNATTYETTVDSPSPGRCTGEAPATCFDGSIRRSGENDKIQEDNHSFSLDSGYKEPGNVDHGGGQKKPEWKRYKQYTQSDMADAIHAVLGGIRVTQAVRKYGVAPRTLYDRLKRLGLKVDRRRYQLGSFPKSLYQQLHLHKGISEAPVPALPEPLDFSAGYEDMLELEKDRDRMDSDLGSSMEREQGGELRRQRRVPRRTTLKVQKR